MTNQPRHIRLVAAVGIALAVAGLPAHGEAPDLDGDGIPNIVDPDIDNDGLPNALDDNVDGGIATSGPFEGRYLGDHLANDNPAEKDIDGDTQADDSLGETDVDGDGSTDDHPSESDIDGDGRDDDHGGERDIDGDGRMDDHPSEDDIDGDGRDDDDDSESDIDGDDSDEDIDGDDRGNGDDAEDDTDGDSLGDDDPADRNTDGDSLGNREDDDDDNDGDSDEDDPDHRGDDDELEIEISLDRVSAPSGSRVRAKIQRMATGKVELEFDGRADTGTMPEGAYQLVVNGTTIGDLVLEADGDRMEGEVEFESNPNQPDELPLDVAVIGQLVEVVRDGVVYFSGTIPTPPDGPTGGGDDNGGDDGIEDDLVVTLDKAPHLSSEVEAKVEVRFGIAGIIGLEIEVEKAPLGSYDVIIGGVSRGTLVVAGLPGESEGALDFDDEANDPGELPLTFNLAGEAIALVLGGEILFSGILPASGI